MLLLENYLGVILSPYHVAIYRDPIPVRGLAGGLAVDLIFGCMLFGVVLALLDLGASSLKTIAWAAALGFCVLKGTDLVLSLFRLSGQSPLWGLPVQLSLFCGAMAGVFLLVHFFPDFFREGINIVRVAFALLGCCIVWVLPQLVFTSVHSKPPVISFNRPVQSSSHQRVIWILFDELSYDQVFDHRQPDLELPQFDDLKRDSIVFSNVQPVGFYTEDVVPSLFLGRDVSKIRSSLDRDLAVYDTAESRWKKFDAQSTVFADAKRAGWTTGVAGWYNPYCHILGSVLDSCDWAYSNEFDPELLFESSDRSIPVSALNIIADMVQSDVDASPSRTTEKTVAAHTQDYRSLMAASDSLIRDESIDFVYLHLPVPHPLGIYSRRRHLLGVKGSYLDNLALADQALGEMLKTIQQTRRASQTTIIVQSDHSWRVGMWRTQPGWTAEGERASGGQFDSRPVLLIHFPGETAGELHNDPFPQLRTTAMLRAAFDGEIRQPEDLKHWLATQ